MKRLLLLIMGCSYVPLAGVGIYSLPPEIQSLIGLWCYDGKKGICNENTTILECENRECVLRTDGNFYKLNIFDKETQKIKESFPLEGINFFTAIYNSADEIDGYEEVKNISLEIKIKDDSVNLFVFFDIKKHLYASGIPNEDIMKFFGVSLNEKCVLKEINYLKRYFKSRGVCKEILYYDYEK